MNSKISLKKQIFQKKISFLLKDRLLLFFADFDLSQTLKGKLKQAVTPEVSSCLSGSLLGKKEKPYIDIKVQKTGEFLFKRSFRDLKNDPPGVIFPRSELCPQSSIEKTTILGIKTPKRLQNLKKIQILHVCNKPFNKGLSSKVLAYGQTWVVALDDYADLLFLKGLFLDNGIFLGGFYKKPRTALYLKGLAEKIENPALTNYFLLCLTLTPPRLLSKTLLFSLKNCLRLLKVWSKNPKPIG